MSQHKFLQHLITSLEDKELDQVAKLYLEEVESLSNIINCNGPYDSGLDMRPINFSDIDTQYQITSREKRFESKLKEDLAKAKANHTDYGLTDRVTYFYSHPLSTTQLLQFKKLAKETFGIRLEILEANALAGAATIYNKIKDLLLQISELNHPKIDSDFFNDPKVKSFYDLMSFGSTTDIKYNIIKSFVLNFLLNNPSVEKAELKTVLNSHFSAALDDGYFEGFLQKLSSERKIKKNTSNKFDLTDNERQRLQDVLEVYQYEETLLKKELLEILEEYDLQDSLEEVIIQLCRLYESNYEINLGEFTKRNTDINDLTSATDAFNSFLKERMTDPSHSELLAKKLFNISDKNEILSRISAGSVYSKVSDPDRLQEYISRHNKNKEIFLDTNVIINLLFVHYDGNADFNSNYKTAKRLMHFCKEQNLHLKTLRSYALETANVFREALSIVPFTKLKAFEKLGGSSNIVYKYFQHLKDWNSLHEETDTFESFLKDYGIEKRGNPEYNHLPQIEFLLESMGIEIETSPTYNLAVAKDLISRMLTTKSPSAVQNDAIMLMRLSDRDVDINPMDPIFCTWDMSLIEVRKKYFKDYPNCTKWLMYTPTRLMDHFSMMNLQVKPGVLTNEVLTILEEDFGFQAKTKSLLDIMVTIINPNDEVGLKYTNKLAEIKEKEIIQVDHKEEGISDDAIITSSAIEIIFNDLYKNYINLGENSFTSFKSLFTKDEFFEDVLTLLTAEIKTVSHKKKTTKELFTKMDALINKSNNA